MNPRGQMRDASFETKQREKKTRLDRKIEDLLSFNSDEKSCKEGREQRIRCWTSEKKGEWGLTHGSDDQSPRCLWGGI